MTLWIKNPLSILSDQDAAGGVVIDNDVIIELVPSGGQPRTDVERIYDAGNLVVLPGLVNTHHHYYQTLTRALPAALNKELFAWLHSLYPVWARLEPEMIGVATELATAELLLSGCTTSADHHYLFPPASTEAVDIQVQAVRKTGIRSVLTRGSMSLGVEQGGLPPQSTVQDEDTILADCERVIQAYHDPHPGSRLQIALAPCSPFSVSTGLMSASAAMARQYGVRLHTHLAETGDENTFCERMFGARPLDYLERVGWLDQDVWLAHGIHFNDAEIQRLGQAGVGISHCPSSNMVLGSGQCRVTELEQAGSPVGLGVDGSASSDCSNLIQEVRQAMLLQRLRYGSAAISHIDALRWATVGSACCLGRQDIGMIAPGKQADLALFDLDALRFSGVGDPLAGLLLSGAHRAHSVMVAGQWLVQQGQLVGHDLDELQARHSTAAKKLQQLN